MEMKTNPITSFERTLWVHWIFKRIEAWKKKKGQQVWTQYNPKIPKILIWIAFPGKKHLTVFLICKECWIVWIKYQSSFFNQLWHKISKTTVISSPFKPWTDRFVTSYSLKDLLWNFICSIAWNLIIYFLDSFKSENYQDWVMVSYWWN